jgi:murein DD-endopeptidase MepM/ murein hydrolase activator NlpD
MKFWPVPNSYSKKIPLNGNPGSFWEYRGDRFHSGIDIYAPEGSEVLSVDDGKVIDTGKFTSPKTIPYWNKTYYLLIKNNDGFFCKYAELGSITVKTSENVKAGQIIGQVGLVIDANKITNDSPNYIKRLKKDGKTSMLHFELCESRPNQNKNYLGGNYFINIKPKNLLDPTSYLANFY